jgi:MFS family permease
VRLLPGALAAPFGGLIGDRASRRSVLVASALGNAVLLGGAAAAAALGAPVAVVFIIAGLSTVAICPLSRPRAP